jgi:anti-sigma28 factor (negative regulator of flagellin synthesis)
VCVCVCIYTHHTTDRPTKQVTLYSHPLNHTPADNTTPHTNSEPHHLTHTAQQRKQQHRRHTTHNLTTTAQQHNNATKNVGEARVLEGVEGAELLQALEEGRLDVDEEGGEWVW